MANEDLVTIATYITAVEADMAKARLAAEGIRAFELGGLPFAGATGISLQVSPDDAERAREVLGIADTQPDRPRRP